MFQTFLVGSGHLQKNILTRKANRMASRWNSTLRLFNLFLGIDGENHIPCLSEVISAAAFATHGYLTPNDVKKIRLVNLDVSDVHADDIASLIRCNSDLLLDNVHGDLTHVLRNVKRGRLSIRNMNLTSEDTEHLRFAMANGARSVSFGDHGSEVTLDMDTLA